MDNKTLGSLLLVACLLLGSIIFAFNSALSAQLEESCSCTEGELGFCPHQQHTPLQTYLGIIVISGIGALGVYLIFFERSQKEIASALSRHKTQKLADEKFDILLKALSAEERSVMKAVREQEGITQQTLRLRTGLHKSKLSIVLDNLEKKQLLARKKKGKTKQVFIKIAL